MAQTADTADVLVLGAGMAGASVGCFLAEAGARVVVLERENQPGYHSTGRSAALFSETYGPPLVRRLSTASRAFLTDPPDGFAAHPLLTPRGVLIVGTDGEADSIDAAVAEGRALGTPMERLDAPALRTAMPALRPGAFTCGVLEPGARDMDVHAIHHGFLRGLRRAGGRLETDAEAVAVSRETGSWRVTTRRGAVHEAPVVVNAAGAWADVMADRAGVRRLGLVPKRRTAIIVDPPPGLVVADWPLTGDLAETFYVKPDAGRLFLSPADAMPVTPQDVQPELIDVARAVARLNEVTTLGIERPVRAWAGLRSFVPDGVPVAGYAADAPGFFWLAGQGGYGIQTAVGLGRAAAALVVGRALPQDLDALEVTAADLAPDRASLVTKAATAVS